MIVTRENYTDALNWFCRQERLALDTETTGLRPYHGDRLFSLILAAELQNQEILSCYFNFLPYADLDPGCILLPEHLEGLRPLLADPGKTWFLHNAKFDMAMLANEGLFIGGEIHCTKAMARVIYNEHNKYSLAACAERVGLKKDDAVEEYIKAHKLWEWATIPGKSVRKKKLFFTRVPFYTISKYGETDGAVTLQLGLHQEKKLKEIADETKDAPRLPTVLTVQANEKKLTHTVFHMERMGLRIDQGYCVRAARYEADRAEKAVAGFKRETGREFSASPKLFQDVFSSERDKWVFTDKGNPSFEGDLLKRFANPAARLILEYRDAKSKSDFYQGFLYHCDSQGIVHPNLNADGTATGRFSSSDPNFQNLTSEEDEETLQQEFVIRRAIIPRPGTIFFMPDYEQLEYKFALELACRHIREMTPLAKRVVGGEDFHQAVTDMVAALTGNDLGRKKVKNANFAKLYGAGYAKLAEMLKCTYAEAETIARSVDAVAPEIQKFSQQVSRVAKVRGHIFNWLGRRCYFPDPHFAYKATNYLVQGGCADVVKVAMNRVHDALKGTKSAMILQVHDELLIEVHDSELLTVPKLVHELMVTSFPSQYVPLTSSAEWSAVSMADKRKGWPA